MKIYRGKKKEERGETKPNYNQFNYFYEIVWFVALFFTLSWRFFFFFVFVFREDRAEDWKFE